MPQISAEHQSVKTVLLYFVPLKAEVLFSKSRKGNLEKIQLLKFTMYIINSVYNIKCPIKRMLPGCMALANWYKKLLLSMSKLRL